MGWKDWPLNKFSVKASPSVYHSEVSFPSDWYNPEVANIEAEGIWAETRALRILEFLKENGIRVIWEVGSGNGNVAIPLRKSGIAVIGIEPLRSGVEGLANNGFAAYWGTLEDLAFPDASIEAIGIFDVLEHLEQPEIVMTEIRRVLKPGGLLITTVPANQWLFSDFDLSIGHFRRYSRKSLQKLLVQNGFSSNKIQYIFLALILPALILRTIPYKLGRRKNFQSEIYANSGLDKLMRILKPLLKAILMVERKLPLPIGLSLISCSHKVD
jgi:SAM-dependent methyltransferase